MVELDTDAPRSRRLPKSRPADSIISARIVPQTSGAPESRTSGLIAVALNAATETLVAGSVSGQTRSGCSAGRSHIAAANGCWCGSLGLRSRRPPCEGWLERGLSALEVAVPSSLQYPIASEEDTGMGVIIGMDPHRSSATIEVVDERSAVVSRGRFGTDRAGYAAMLAEGRRHGGRDGGRGVGGGRLPRHRPAHRASPWCTTVRRCSTCRRACRLRCAFSRPATDARPTRSMPTRWPWPPCTAPASSRW